jgi:hypothetical protein
VVTKAATLPEAYIIPPEWWEVVARIELHGVAFARIAEEVTLDVETYRFHDVAWAEKPFEGRHRVTFAFDAEEEERTYPAGSIVVDMNQRAARVAAHILEPDSPDSFVSWGFFDAIFEQKEYAEGYVLEPMAREMLAGDPALRAAFEKKKAEDEAFAADPKAIRRWFYRRTPYWDEQKDLYPVGRIMRRADVERILR